MSLPSINKLIEQFNITMFNTDMKSYFFPISERLGLSKNVFTYHATVKEIKLERDDVINITFIKKLERIYFRTIHRYYVQNWFYILYKNI